MRTYRLGVVVAWLTTLAIIIILFFNCPNVFYSLEYYTLCINLAVIWLIWVLKTSVRRIDFFEPIVLLTAIHLLLFEITPIICIFNNDMLWFGQNLWDGCVKATWVSTAGYIAIVLAYFRHDRHVKILKNHDNICFFHNGHNCLLLNYVLWTIGFISGAILIVSQGANIFFLLALGLRGAVGNVETSSSLEFLAVISYMMIPSYLYIFQLSKSKIIKLILFYLMLACFIVRGFRFILVAVIISPLVCHYICKNKRPKFLQIVLICSVLIIMIGFIGATRDGIRAGAGVSKSAISVITGEYLFDIIIENFSIFKTYYGIILNIPNLMPFTHGQLIFLYTAIMFIPRFIWASKPYPISRSVNAVAVSDYASRAGTAYPYIGEYYHEFGIIGVLIFCYILGMLCKKLRHLLYSKNIHSIIAFATIYPLLMQIMIRGYTPSNFYMLVFCLVPIMVTQSIERRCIK